MARKKMFCKTARVCDCYKLRARHEFDVRYYPVYSDRIKDKANVDFDKCVCSDNVKFINTSCLVNKICLETGLPERIIGDVLLTFIDTIYVCCQNKKNISIQDLGKLIINENDILFLPSNHLKEALNSSGGDNEQQG